jgi:pilus assembly protein Flp/PilA
MVRSSTLIVVQAALKRDRGATAVEYALMVAIIALVIIASVTTVGQTLLPVFDHLGRYLNLNGCKSSCP